MPPQITVAVLVLNNLMIRIANNSNNNDEPWYLISESDFTETISGV